MVYSSIFDSNHETNATERKRNNIQKVETNCMLTRTQNIKIFRFSKLMSTNIFESQNVGKTPYGSTAQLTLFPAQINSKWKTCHM